MHVLGRKRGRGKHQIRVKIAAVAAEKRAGKPQGFPGSHEIWRRWKSGWALLRRGGQREIVPNERALLPPRHRAGRFDPRATGSATDPPFRQAKRARPPPRAADAAGFDRLFETLPRGSRRGAARGGRERSHLCRRAWHSRPRATIGDCRRARQCGLRY